MINECSVRELKQKLDSKENIQFIDCREQAEWNEAHIAGATLLPLSEIETKYENIQQNKIFGISGFNKKSISISSWGF